MRKIENGAAFGFIAAVIILTGISILGVWDFFAREVIHKSTQTLGLLAFVAIVVMIAGRFIDSKQSQDGVPEPANPVFTDLRKIILIILIISVSILALLGVLAIWDVFTDKAILTKTIVSVAILAFSSFIIVLTCMDRENNPMLHKKNANSFGPLIAIFIILGLLFFFAGGFP